MPASTYGLRSPVKCYILKQYNDDQLLEKLSQVKAAIDSPAAAIALANALYAEIIRRYKPHVLGAIVSIAGPKRDHDILDVCQATFLVFCRRFRKVHKGHLQEWLCAVATRLAKNHFWKRVRERQVEIMPEKSSVESVEVQWLQILNEHLHLLSEEQRELLEMIREGLSNGDIAKKLGVHKGTVSRRKESAIEEMRQELERRKIIVAGLGPIPACAGQTVTHLDPAFTKATAAAAAAFAAGQSKPSGASAAAVALAERFLSWGAKTFLLSLGIASALVFGASELSANCFTGATPSGIANATLPASQPNPEAVNERIASAIKQRIDDVTFRGEDKDLRPNKMGGMEIGTVGVVRYLEEGQISVIDVTVTPQSGGYRLVVQARVKGKYHERHFRGVGTLLPYEKNHELLDAEVRFTFDGYPSAIQLVEVVLISSRSQPVDTMVDLARAAVVERF